MLWIEPEQNNPNNYSFALGYLYSFEGRFRRDPKLKSLRQQSIDQNAEKRFVKILDKSIVKGNTGNNGICCTNFC